MNPLTVVIQEHWNPEQAMAVLDLLDELRQAIWARYDLALLEAYRADRAPPPPALPSDEPPF